MNKREYFLTALAAETYRRKDWVISCFSVVKEKKGEDYPFKLFHTEDGYFFLSPAVLKTDGLMPGILPDPGYMQVKIDDAEPNEPLLRFKEPLQLFPEEMPNLSYKVKTTYGNCLFNWMVLVYAFGSKFPYQEGEIKAKALEKVIEAKIENDPENPSERREDVFYVSEYKRFVDAMFALVGFTQLCVPSATEKSLTTDPRIPELRRQLLEKNKDRLNDPAVIAEIERELIAMDKEWLKGDPAEGFYDDKGYSVKRKKLYLMHGIESGFKDNGEFELIENSLDEGWDITKLPSMVNSLREGSYNRGAQTALGGEAAKFLGRVFQNAVISEEDCGSTLGWTYQITSKNVGDFVGLFEIKAGRPVEITEERKDSLIGKAIMVRGPMFCKTEAPRFCATCMGKKISVSPTSLTMHAVSVGTRIMSSMMAAMHGKKLDTAPYEISTSIT